MSLETSSSRLVIPGLEHTVIRAPIDPSTVEDVNLPVKVNGYSKEFKHTAITEFGWRDGWSVISRLAIEKLGMEGEFDGKNIFEAGIGDSRLTRLATEIAFQREKISKGRRVLSVTGIDIDRSKLDIAYDNLRRDEAMQDLLQDGMLRLYSGDVIAYLHELKQGGQKFENGVALACLPQSKGFGTSSDVIVTNGILQQYAPKWDETALTLNAAFLDGLRKVSTPDVQAMVILSDRLHEDDQAELIESTGWRIKSIPAQGKVFQDKDTNINWMESLKKTGQFYDGFGNPLPSVKDAIYLIGQGYPIQHGVKAFHLEINTNHKRK